MAGSEYIETSEAMEKAKVSRTTIITWANKYGIGTKVGGRWKIKREEFEQFLKGICPEGSGENSEPSSGE